MLCLIFLAWFKKKEIRFYWAVCEVIKNRLEKARSVWNRRKEIETPVNSVNTVTNYCDIIIEVGRPLPQSWY